MVRHIQKYMVTEVGSEFNKKNDESITMHCITVYLWLLNPVLLMEARKFISIVVFEHNLLHCNILITQKMKKKPKIFEEKNPHTPPTSSHT